MKSLTKLLIVLPFLILISGHEAVAEIEDSVVRIVNQSNRFNWYTPWDSGSTGKGTGSGFVIKGKKIMTNAHVVSDAALLLVYFHNDPTPYPARISAIGHDCDLAVLELIDETRIKTVPALEFDGLPRLRSKVETYGYPAGGKLLSSTAGVVSRIEPRTYVHAGTEQFLAVQTDAAINPGNSGGPVIQNGKVVGVAFQGNEKLENMGFFIPGPVITHFLEDLTDDQYDGFPYLGILAANLKNPAARAYAGMNKQESGIRIDNIGKHTSTDGILQVNDIVTSIDGYPIANDGTVEWNGLRLTFSFLLSLKQIGEPVTFSIIRKNERLTKKVVLNSFSPNQVHANLYDKKPEYYIYSGLVFAPLNREILKTYSKKWIVSAPQELVYEMYYRPLIENRSQDIQKVVQIRRLDHEVNAEEAKYLYRIIESVNDQPIATLDDVVKAFKNNTNQFHVIQFEYGNRITVLDRAKADAAHDEILNRYAIPKDRRL